MYKMGIPMIENLSDGNSQDRQSEEGEFPQSIMYKMGIPRIKIYKIKIIIL